MLCQNCNASKMFDCNTTLETAVRCVIFRGFVPILPASISMLQAASISMRRIRDFPFCNSPLISFIQSFMDLIIFFSHCIVAKSIQFSFSLKDALTFSFSNVKFMVESLITCWPDSEPDFFFRFFFFSEKFFLLFCEFFFRFFFSPLESYSFIWLPVYD